MNTAVPLTVSMRPMPTASCAPRASKPRASKRRSVTALENVYVAENVALAERCTVAMRLRPSVQYSTRATLEGVAFSVADLGRAMEADMGARIARLRVDGGASENDLLMQFQSDVLDVTIDRPANVETTALGAAYLAGLAVGAFDGLDAVRKAHRVAKTFSPAMSESDRATHLARWADGVSRTRSSH